MNGIPYVFLSHSLLQECLKTPDGLIPIAACSENFRFDYLCHQSKSWTYWALPLLHLRWSAYLNPQHKRFIVKMGVSLEHWIVSPYPSFIILEVCNRPDQPAHPNLTPLLWLHLFKCLVWTSLAFYLICPDRLIRSIIYTVPFAIYKGVYKSFWTEVTNKQRQ
jgi:hypothetical protein